MSTTTKPAPLTAKEKAEAVKRFLANKREQYVTIALGGLTTNPSVDVSTKARAEALADTAVAIADALMERLYPVNDAGE